MQREHHRKVSVTGPPTCSSSAGLMTGMPVPWQRVPVCRVPLQRNHAVAKQRLAQRSRLAGCRVQ
jgi:hypothetical protein